MITKMIITMLLDPICYDEPENGFEMLIKVFLVICVPFGILLDILLLPIEIICLIIGRVKYGRWII